jgi:hypothetical protein
VKKTLLAILLALALVVVPVGSVFAATSDTVTVNATPAFISIAVTQASWTINGGGDSMIRKDTEYYATVTNTTAAPSNPVVNNDCYFDLVNSSTVATDITLTCTDFSGGDAWTNAESKTNGANAFAMLSYFSGDSWVDFATSGVIVKTSGSDIGKSDLAATTSIKFGIGFDSPTGDPTSSTAQSGTITVSAAEHV